MAFSNHEQVKTTVDSVMLGLVLINDIKQTLNDKTPGFEIAFPSIQSLDETSRRNVTRVIFSYIEASVFSHKAWVAAHRNHFHLSPDELNCVKEVSAELNEKGELRLRRAKINLERNILFMFQLLFRVTGRTEKLTGTVGWDELLIAIKVRDRLTHPKSLDDLKVGDSEMESIINTYNWFECLRNPQVANAVKIFEEPAKEAGVTQ